MNNITAFVQEVFGDYTGFCVEAGAYDGILESTTLELENLGWTCLCIEPNAQIFQELVKNRALCLECALASENKDDVPFEIYRTPKSGEASFSAFEAREALQERFGYFEKRDVLVHARTLDYCLETTGFPRLDVLSLDVEGWEMEVLRGFDAGRWSPRALVIENISREKCLRDYLSGLGYGYVKRDAYNDFFVKQE